MAIEVPRFDCHYTVQQVYIHLIFGNTISVIEHCIVGISGPLLPAAPERYLRAKDRLAAFGEEVNKKWPKPEKGPKPQKPAKLAGRMLEGFEVCLFLYTLC